MSAETISALTKQCTVMADALEEAIKLLETLTTQSNTSTAHDHETRVMITCEPAPSHTSLPTKYRVDFVWKAINVRSSLTVIWNGGKHVSFHDEDGEAVTARYNRYNTLTVTWRDELHTFTANVKDNFPTPSLWRGIRVSGVGMCPRKSFTYEVIVLG